jgi:predicted 3-demethylubiquinone-9 3-methyltransferase (glyoxalase superfamily)
MTDIALTTPQLWFDNEAREAAAFYCSVFPDSSVLRVTKLHDTPSGAVDVAETDRYWDTLSAVPEAEAAAGARTATACPGGSSRARWAR